MSLTLDEEAPFQSVAIIGMAGRFPGAADVDAFWANLAAGVESIRHFDEAALIAAGVPEELRRHPAYVAAGARLPQAEDFDPEFFDMTPREAEITDPQHRVLLETAAEALQSAGYVASRHPGAIAIYAGVGLNTYLLHNLLPRTDLLRTLGMHQLLLGNDKCYATSRIAYKLNLTGQCVSVDTACSSGLVAVTMAYRSLISFECDMALAGGAKVNATDCGYVYEPGSINSADGHCRPFDAQANGTVFGSGVGMVVLKRLEDALRDRDDVLAVIRGAATNNDGSAKVGFTAPSVNRQRDVIRQALAFAEVPPESIGYVEAHGTGTRLGDPIEIAALSEAFARAPGRAPCAIGSAKGNIGHLESAAGVAGLIKTVQALRHRQLPPSLHFAVPNPAIDFAGGGFEVNTRLRPWPQSDVPRRAGVSSFGLGGTNAHVILEEAPAVAPTVDDGPQLLLWSARNAQTLAQATARLQARLGDDRAPALADAAYTLACGREHFGERRFLVADAGAQAAALLDRAAFGGATVMNADGRRLRVAFVFPGQGVQRPGMASDLYRAEPVYREAIDACCAIAQRTAGLDLRPLLLDRDAAADALDRTALAQPAIFAASYAMARLWQRWGVQPDLLLGHSLGEYVAACIAGVFTLEDALSMVVARAGLMDALPTGAMAALTLSEPQTRALLRDPACAGAEIAAVNGPAATVVSGPHAAIEACLAAARAQGQDGRILRTSHAFHSSMLEPILERCAAAFAGVRMTAPTLPVVSCLTGALADPARLATPAYWVEQMRRPVRFAEVVRTALAQPIDVFIDLGPATAAAGLVMANLGDARAAVLSAAPAQADPTDGVSAALRALGGLWARGADLPWSAFYADRPGRRVQMPLYPFQRRRCWVEPPAPADTPVDTPVAAPTAPVAPTAAGAAASGALPEPRLDASAFEEAPSDELVLDENQRVVAAVWEELLGVRGIGLHDSFFALGGQSLLATRVMSRLHEITGVELPVETIFAQPTIAGVADALFERRLAQTDPEELERLLAEL